MSKFSDFFAEADQPKFVSRMAGVMARNAADANRKSSVMSRPQGVTWKPEYEQEPALEAPMVSPDDLIGTGIPTKLAGLATMGAKALAGHGAMGSLLGAVGHTAWHGSPHVFDKFALEKIGTGEGRQQQGMGAYLAEAKAVGQKYADRLADMHGVAEGNLYKTDLPDEAMQSLAHYSKPFNDQPEAVKKSILPLIDDNVKHSLRGYYGWDSHEEAPIQAIIEAMDITNNNNRNLTAKALRSNGVLGVKYPDGLSRGTGEGTSNFVIFEPDMIRVLERNGQPTGAQPWKPGEWQSSIAKALEGAAR